jgi:hypothetical protein
MLAARMDSSSICRALVLFHRSQIKSGETGGSGSFVYRGLL